MEKKQSSVEWLENQLKERYSLMNSELFEQAKAMHREETEQFGAVCCFKTTQKNQWSLEGLYNETFKGEDEESK